MTLWTQLQIFDSAPCWRTPSIYSIAETIMKWTSLSIALVIFIAGCDNSVDIQDSQTESEEAVLTQLSLSQQTADFSLAVDAAESLTQEDPGQGQGPPRRVRNELATLGRVLFYEKQLSSNGSVSCASCHRQAEGFADSRTFSPGFEGVLTNRQAMSVANVRFYRSGRMFWDERAESLEAQALEPIQHPGEMGLTLTEAVERVEAQPYYSALFQNAFGDDAVNPERIAEAIATFERSIVTTNSRYNQWLAAGGNNADLARGRGGPGDGGPRNGGPGNGGPGNGGPGNGGPGNGGPDNNNGNTADGNIAPDPALISQFFSDQEDLGRRLFFSPRTQCSRCHAGRAFVGDRPRNNGLDLDTSADQGAGDGRFKMASLKNIELTAPYMHDGRFQTLEQVVQFYNNGIQDHPDLDNRLTNRRGNPIRMNLSAEERDALVAFMKMLTDETLATEERFSDPFLN